MVTLLLPRLASATPSQVETEINKFYAGKTLTEGKIKLDLPRPAQRHAA